MVQQSPNDSFLYTSQGSETGLSSLARLGDALMVDIDGPRLPHQVQGLKARQGACCASTARIDAAVPDVLPLCQAWRIA